jgi:hypothetical protein
VEDDRIDLNGFNFRLEEIMEPQLDNEDIGGRQNGRVTPIEVVVSLKRNRWQLREGGLEAWIIKAEPGTLTLSERINSF